MLVLEASDVVVKFFNFLIGRKLDELYDGSGDVVELVFTVATLMKLNRKFIGLIVHFIE